QQVRSSLPKQIKIINNMTMKNLLKINNHLLGLLVLCAISFTSCSKDDDPAPPKEKEVDVYVVGAVGEGKDIAKLWKSGVATNLSDGSRHTYARAVYVSGTDVYVAGYEINGSKNVAKLWKNGIATNLTDGTKTAVVNSVYVSLTDVYVAGYEYNGTKNVA